MQIAELIKEWSAEVLEPNVFLVDVEYKTGSGKMLVLLDSDEALTIEQCRKLNRHLSEKLDEMDFGDHAYTLEVSSPGVDRALKISRQYPKHIGREFKVLLKSKTELFGKLLEANENQISLQLKDAKKGFKAKEPVIKEIPFSDIEEAWVIVSFK